MAQPNLALRTTRNGLFSHCVVAGSKNPLPLGMGSVKKIWALYNSLQDAINYVKNKDKTTEVVTTDGESASKNYLAPNLKDKSEVELLDLSAAVGYVSQTYKTENRRLVSGVNCSNDKPFRDMQTTRTKYGTFSGLLGYHCVQSFSPGEIDPDEAHLIGLMTAQKIWGEDGYQVVVATHIDRNHIHNHFVVSSVSILGYRNPCCYHRKIAAISDEIVRSCGLSIIENPGQNPAVFPHLTARQTQAKLDTDEGLSLCGNQDEFVRYMYKRGYSVCFDINRQYWTIQHETWQRPMRLVRLGQEYSNANILYRLAHEYFRPVRDDVWDTMTAKQRYDYEDRYRRIQANWKNTYQYKYFMFVLRNLGINLNDYKIHRSRYSRDDQKRIDAGWRMLDTIAFMNKNSISTVSQAREFENINIHKIEHYELIRKKFRNKLYVARRFKHPEEEIINLQKNIDQVNLILESLRKDGRQVEKLLVDKDPEISIEENIEIDTEYNV